MINFNIIKDSMLNSLQQILFVVFLIGYEKLLILLSLAENILSDVFQAANFALLADQKKLKTL